MFAAACREPFLGIALPLFEAAPLDRQPALVVDAGCGTARSSRRCTSRCASGPRGGGAWPNGR